MHWLKNSAVDLLATLVIAIVVFFDSDYHLEYIVYIYTGLMVLARTITLFSSNFRAITKKKVSEAPQWVYHLLYFLNTGILIFGGFYITAACWAYIWGVAWYVHSAQRKK
ncbi:MAG: hypothetical protein R3283_10515 [Balneolaceae bacterium]|nr:hypothetical protein [Balneolaceae bacterium]